MSRLALTSVLCLPAMLAAIATADAPLRLNEIRLEQPGADNDEYIELAGAPGESLAGVAIVARVVNHLPFQKGGASVDRCFSGNFADRIENRTGGIGFPGGQLDARQLDKRVCDEWVGGKFQPEPGEESAAFGECFWRARATQDERAGEHGVGGDDAPWCAGWPGGSGSAPVHRNRPECGEICLRRPGGERIEHNA